MGEHINVQDGGFALEIATNLYGYGYFNQNQIEINNGTFETLADNGGAIRLAIYDGDFYMLMIKKMVENSIVFHIFRLN